MHPARQQHCTLPSHDGLVGWLVVVRDGGCCLFVAQQLYDFLVVGRTRQATNHTSTTILYLFFGNTHGKICDVDEILLNHAHIGSILTGQRFLLLALAVFLFTAHLEKSAINQQAAAEVSSAH
jgi:hypothetical protein